MTHAHAHAPRLGCGDFSAVRDAAAAGLGVVHLVFSTRNRLSLLVRAWIEELAVRFRDPALFARKE